jgi:hypothetical protein
MPKQRDRMLVVLAASLAMPPTVPTVSAQNSVTEDSVASERASVVTMVAGTGGLILAGATGAQLIRTPKDWSQTWDGFGYRVADQTGFYLVQTSTFHVLGRALGYRPDSAPCPQDALVGCAFTATFTAFDRAGRRRPNVPLMTSIVIGTGASLLWRPERRVNRESWAFVGTRLGITFGGYVAERLLVDWWSSRRAVVTSSAGGGKHATSTR